MIRHLALNAQAAMLFTAPQLRFAQTVARIAHCNPFLAERIELEREALGEDFDERDADWNRRSELGPTPGNVQLLLARTEELLVAAREALAGGKRPGDAERELYRDLVYFALYQRYREGFDESVASVERGRPAASVASLYDRIRRDGTRYLTPLGEDGVERELAHLFALSFQVRRAFRNVFLWIVGVSQPAVRLRAEVWQSIFTHDLRRYRRALCERMADFTTLVTGPSGTGKELVARAIGLSRFVRFDPGKKAFLHDVALSFQSLNLSALSPTLIESELFGHKRGAFTGAISDHRGWLEGCPEVGSVFLDEIGELDSAIQVKLLRVLQDRTFSRLGETKERHFPGKIIAATNRDLATEMGAGRFREDLYYRLCSDIVTTPSLAERVRDSVDELPQLVRFLSTRLAGDEADSLADEALAWINAELGPDYSWPGNVRELEQCVRNILIRHEYRPPRAAAGERGPHARLAAQIAECELSAEELLGRYCTLAYHRIGTYEGAARRLGLDRRTVRAKIDAGLLAELRGSGA
ncbi:MAG: sigma 54-interacting transcriptional regulator [Planctomycetota bacterium]